MVLGRPGQGAAEDNGHRGAGEFIILNEKCIILNAKCIIWDAHSMILNAKLQVWDEKRTWKAGSPWHPAAAVRLL